MEKIVIEGGHPLRGAVPSSGAKNAALPILIATLLAPGEHRLARVPELADVSSTLSLLGRMGCPSLASVEASGEPDGALRLDTTRVAYNEAPYDLVRKMRASVLVLGPLLARCGEARVSLPGGCAIGVRPIDQHLKGLEALGCRFELANGYVHGHAPELRGARVDLDVPTVTGTENIVMAAVLARGTSRVTNAAREPEVVDLCRFLRTLGARIEGEGTSTIEIEGVDRLTPASRPYRILPDRIETGTYLVAAAATGGDVTVTDTDPTLLQAVLDVLEGMGARIETTSDTIRLTRNGPLRPFEITTEPFPGFPTDMQAQLMALACVVEGTSTIVETIFENRFLHAAELARMGARITTAGNTARVAGTGALQGASVMASDLRASAALVVAALAARGLTEVLRIYHLDRGYDDLAGKLASLGARIARVGDDVVGPERLAAALAG
jgi:UDP-N-acetylglucosamine 1-carboxyvinyltransferase